MTRALHALVGCLSVLVGVASLASVASAQSPAAGEAQDAAAGSRWQVTFRAGGGSAGTPASGLSSVPPPGLPVNDGPFFSTRRVPSWFFGDGTKLFNSRTLFGKTITPLDPVIGAAATGRSSGASFGIAASRRLSPRLRLDFSLDGADIGPRLTAGSRTAIESTRASFADAFSSMLTIATNPSVSSTASVTGGGGIEWTATSSLEIVLRARGRTTWYVTAGGGVVTDTGTVPTVKLTGHYAFNEGSGPFDETDTVVVHAGQSRARFIGVVGGGWTRDLSRRWALNADLRVGISPSGLTTSVDTTPSRVLTDPTHGFALGFGPSPAVVFDNVSQDSNTLSSLNVKLSGVKTFVSTGPQFRVLVSAGLVVRF